MCKSLAPSHYITMSIYLVKLLRFLKRLLDFKSLLLFLIKCTAERTPAACAVGERQSSRLPPPPGLSDQGTRLDLDAGAAARLASSWPFYSLCRRKSRRPGWRPRPLSSSEPYRAPSLRRKPRNLTARAGGATPPSVRIRLSTLSVTEDPLSSNIPC